MAASTYEEARLDLIDLQAHRYRKSHLESMYTRDRGLLVIPVMGPVGTAPVVARVHAPVATRRVEFEYIKQNAPPVFPAAADTTSGDTILDETIVFPAPSMNPENQLMFGVRGVYEFVQAGDGRGPEDQFPIDSHPFPTNVDMLGQIDLGSVTGTSRLRTPANNFVEKHLESSFNSQVIDSRQLMGYNIIG